MSPVIHSQKKGERRPLERKRSQQFKRTNRRDKDKSRIMKWETKDYDRKNGKYDVIVEDFFIDYKLPASDNKMVNSPNGNAVQKRKLSTDDDYEWDWAPYPRRLKSERNDTSLYNGNGSLSDEFDDSNVVPNWDEAEEESIGLSSCEGDTDDLLHSKATDIQIVTVVKLPNEHDLYEEPICFDIHKLCEMVRSEENSDENLINVNQNALDALLTFANDKNARLMIFDDEKNASNDVKPSEPYSPLMFEGNDSDEVEECEDVWQNDRQIEEFKFARCFKCRRKVKGDDECLQRRNNFSFQFFISSGIHHGRLSTSQQEIG